MMNEKTRSYLVKSLTLLIIALCCFLGYTLTKAFTDNSETDDNLSYVSYEILTDNAMPVTETNENTTEVIAQQNQNINVVRPYTSSDVKIGKNYYNYQDDEKKQEDSIIYYENTYIQNTGIDYVSKNEFDIQSIDNGIIEKISEDDISGTTIKIKHDNNLISIYSSLKDLKVKEKDTVTKGQIIGKSGTNAIGEDLGNHLHFEIYKDNKLINPEDFFNQNKVE